MPGVGLERVCAWWMEGGHAQRFDGFGERPKRHHVAPRPPHGLTHPQHTDHKKEGQGRVHAWGCHLLIQSFPFLSFPLCTLPAAGDHHTQDATPLPPSHPSHT